MFRKLFKLGFVSTLLIFVLLSGGFLAVWQWPHLLINTKNLERAVHLLGKHGIVITWRKADLGAGSLSFFRKQVTFSATGLCVDMKQTKRFCFESAKLAAVVDIKGWFPRYEVGPIRLTGGHIALDMTEEEKNPKEEKKKKSSEEIWPSPPKLLKDVTFSDLYVEIDELTLKTKDLQVQTRISLNALGEANKSRWVAETQGKLEKGAGRKTETYRAHAYLNLQSTQSQWFGPYIIDMAAKARLPGKKVADVKVHGVPKGTNALDYVLDAGFRAEGRQFIGHAEGSADPNGVQTTIRATGYHLAAHFPEATLEGCRVRYGLVQKGKTARRLDLDCPIVARASFQKFSRGPYADVFRRMTLLLRAGLKFDDPEPGTIDGSVELHMDPILRKAEEGSATIATRISGAMHDFPHRLNFDSQLNLRINQFQRLVKMFHNMPWAVPEPFNQLDGPIQIQVQGKGELAGRGGRLPIQFQTRLSGTQQRLFLDGAGQLQLELKPEMKSHLQFQLTLSDVQLVLPHLDMAAPPRFLPDSRIHRFKEKTKREIAEENKPSTFTYEFKVLSPPNHPIQLISNLAQRPVPINLSLRGATDAPVRGYVRIASFPVELFRRTATVEHLNLGLGKNPDATEINGEIKVVYTDYTIRIKILGLAQSPTIKFLSEPPLSEDQVIAVLLFGKTIDALDPNQAQSVGSTQAAVEDSAISLASMYLLASTPVESIGYDPATQTFSAKVRLADGTSLNVGSNMRDLNQLGIRKRLGNHWAISTYLQNPLDPLQRTLTAFLEWSTGY